MKYLPTIWLHCITIFIAILLDGALALNAAPILYRSPMSASPYLTLIVLILPVLAGLEKQISLRAMYITAILAGLFFDLYYSGIMGIAMVGFPLAVWIASLIHKYFDNTLLAAILSWFFALTFYLFFDYLGFGIINVASGNIMSFLVFHLFPTLILNLILVIIFYPFLTWLYKKTVRRDLASYRVDEKSLDGKLPLNKKN